MLGIMETLEGWAETFKEFIMDNHSNPILWITIILIGLALFGFLYNSLSKNG